MFVQEYTFVCLPVVDSIPFSPLSSAVVADGEKGGGGDKRFAAANLLLWQRYQALAGPIFDVLCLALPLTASAPFSLHSALQDDL